MHGATGSAPPTPPVRFRYQLGEGMHVDQVRAEQGLEGQSGGTTLGEYAGAFRRRWWVIALGAVLGLGLASVYLLIAPKTYLSTATVIVEPMGGSLDNSVDGGRTNSGVNLDTEAQLVNIGEIANEGIEATLDVSAIRNADWGWDVGVNLATNKSNVEGHPLVENNGRPIDWDNHIMIRNPDAIPATRGVLPFCTAANVGPADPCRELNVFRGSNLPTTIMGVSTTLRLPRASYLVLSGDVPAAWKIYLDLY